MDFSSILSCIGYLFLGSMIIYTLMHGAFGPDFFVYSDPNEKYPEKPKWFKVAETITFSGIAIIFIGFWMMILWGIIERALG